MKNKGHIISEIVKGSASEELGIEPGDVLLKINNQDIEDVFDYQYLCMEEYVEVLIKKKNGEEWLLEVDKDYDEELGLKFENGLMDEYHHCMNKCIFCFIDQMPKGMRETLYFKDDDSRLSFLQGNYVTLTNMSDKDVDRICKYHLSPINISFQTMNPKLRCMMLNNRFAGEALKKVDKFKESGITMNGQIVLCKGINDGEELKFSIEKLMEYMPELESVSVVPVGLSKYREGLYPLKPFDKHDAEAVIDLIEEYQKICHKKTGMHFVHASDEWYILAEREVPEEDRYDGYLQIENGVGMVRSLLDEFHSCLKETVSRLWKKKERRITLVTGKSAYPYIKKMCDEIMKEAEGLSASVYPIRNDFFGENITVSGLMTGKDIINQLKDKNLGEELLLPQNVLRSGEQVLLDDVLVSDIEKALQVPIIIVKSSGYEFIKAVLGAE